MVCSMIVFLGADSYLQGRKTIYYRYNKILMKCHIILRQHNPRIYEERFLLALTFIEPFVIVNILPYHLSCNKSLT